MDINSSDPQIVRLPFFDSMTLRDTSLSADRQFINGYFEPVENKSAGGIDYFFTKRPGTTLFSTPTVSGEGRGIYFSSFQGEISVVGSNLYANVLTIPLRTSTGLVSFAETRPDLTVANQYVGINDGKDLYLIGGGSSFPLVLNNVAITSSSVANPTVITAPNHNLLTGYRIIIRNHTGSTPSINDTIFSVTVIDANTFTIPVNVTVGGTGGTIGSFPAGIVDPNSTNTGSLIYMDGYFITSTTDGNIWNCALDDPTTWPSTNFITALMLPGKPVALVKQNNMFLSLSDQHIQTFYNAANPVGSPFANVEQAMQRVGCVSRQTVVQAENIVYWVSNSQIGGYTVYRLDGTSNLQDIGIPQITRVLNRQIISNGWGIAGAPIVTTVAGFSLRIAGHIFYILTIKGSNISFVYDRDLNMWFEWTDVNGSFYNIGSIGIFQTTIVGGPNNGKTILELIGQDIVNGNQYILDASKNQDNGVNFTTTIQTGRESWGTLRRKYYDRVDLVGDKQTSGVQSNINISYSDDDYNTFSTPRTFDMSQTRMFGKAWGNSRRRAWKISYTGDLPLRLSGLEFEIRVAQG